jgi:hypothetical protein
MAVTIGTTDKKFVSAIDFLDQREIDPALYDQSRDRAFNDILKLVGLTKEIASGQRQYHSFVNNDTHEVATVTGTPSGSGTATITFDVDNTFAVVGDLIMTSNAANAGKQARIQSVTGASVVAKSVDGTNLTVAAGDKVAFGSNAYGEGSGAPSGRRYGMTKYFNQTQIFKAYDKITDVEKTAKIEVSVGGQQYMLAYQTIQKVTKLNADISFQMLAGVKSTAKFSDASPSLADAAGNAVQTTGGLNWYNVQYGINDAAATLGTFGWTEIDDMIDNWIANKAPNVQMGFMGSRASAPIIKFLKNLGSSGVTSVRLDFNGQSANFDVEQITYRGFTLQFIHLPILDNPQLFSAVLSPDIAGSIFWVPKDQVEVVGGGSAPRLRIRFAPQIAAGGPNVSTNGLIKEIKTGALAPVATGHDAVLETSWYTEQGLEALGVKHFQKYRVI